jgi:hypothetical protein
MASTDNQEYSDWKPRHNPWLIAVVVAMAAFMEVLDTSIANVALPHMAGNLGASQDQSTWVLTSYSYRTPLFCRSRGGLPLSLGVSGFSYLHRDLHGFLFALWNSSESAISPVRSSDSRRRRRRVTTYGSVNSG